MDWIAADGITWAPSRSVFLRRVLLSSVLTFAGLSAVAITFSAFASLPIGWAFTVAFILTLGFVIEDVMRWRNARTDRWQLSEGQLIHDGPDGRSHVPLSEVVSAKHQFGGRVIVKLKSGQRIAIRYLPFPIQTAEQIDAARGPRAS